MAVDSGLNIKKIVNTNRAKTELNFFCFVSIIIGQKNEELMKNGGNYWINKRRD
jgi:hypothetical protein